MTICCNGNSVLACGVDSSIFWYTAGKTTETDLQFGVKNHRRLLECGLHITFFVPSANCIQRTIDPYAIYSTPCRNFVKISNYPHRMMKVSKVSWKPETMCFVHIPIWRHSFNITDGIEMPAYVIYVYIA